ncbi:Activating signal cointegrator 1 [Tyrophagus putrescentiae]|nr:Activating signal cointegrator 1 [Tyrophagus putrescentiae]
MKKKRGNKGAPLVDAQGKDFMLEGRHPCQCEAGKHDLVNNCLRCGRIVCAQEGAGECFTCGTYVFSKEERSKVLSGSAEAKARIAELTEKGIPLDFVASNSEKRGHRDRLLDYDKTSVARSKVYDDQVDYFTMRTQNFISDDKRKEIQHRIDYLVENKFNREQKLMIDLGAGTVTDVAESVVKDLNAEHRVLEELSKTKSDYEMLPSSAFLQEDSELLKKAPPAVYIPSEEGGKTLTKGKKPLPKAFSMDAYAAKVQDTDMEVIDDRGMCLAMHQPYATLLVAGIKRFEGRTWFSTFKGRLWIYAAARRPTTEEITAVETFYGHLGFSKFPHHYPTGAIVGCVTIDDCLPMSYPIALSRPLPVTKGGGNKIYKLEASVHKAVKSMLGF